MTIFTPTFLYIKQHTKTGKLYFGKTIKNPLNYKGSGRHWLDHITYHGVNDVDTIWFCLFFDEASISEFALSCSSIWNIVEDKQWANLIPESGMGDLFRTATTREKMRQAKLGKPSNMSGKKHTEEAKQKNRDAHVGKSLSDDHKKSISESMIGIEITRSDETKQKISESLTGVSHSEDRIQKMKNTKLNSNMKWYNLNGITKQFPLDTAPENWSLGRK